MAIVKTAIAVAIVIGVALGEACGNGADEVDHGVPIAVVGSLIIGSAFAPEPVTADAGALYFTVTNRGDRADRLLEIAVDGVRSVSLHDQRQSGGAVRMVRVESIAVPAHATVSLQPGGLHAMLEDLQDRYRTGDSLHVHVTFQHGGAMSFLVPVISYADVANRLHESANREGH